VNNALDYLPKYLQAHIPLLFFAPARAQIHQVIIHTRSGTVRFLIGFFPER
jgi:hypothetical protein